MNISKISVFDLFCGAGGFSEGFKHAGFTVAAGFDNDLKSLSTFNYNFEKRGFLNDLAKTNAKEILSKTREKNRDNCIIIAGPPCQGFSIVNGRKEDIYEENLLLIRTAQLIRDINPIYFVVENVIPIKSVENGYSFERFSQIINKETDYIWDYKVLDAVDFGIPQKRKRIFLMGNRLGNAIKFPVGDDNGKISVKEAISDLPSLKYNEEGKNPTNYMKEPKTEYQKLMRKECREYLWNHIITVSDKKIIERYKKIHQGESYIDAKKRMRKKIRIKVKFSNVYRRFKADEPAPTIANPRKSMYIHYKENRGLSVREVARLQSFPDKFIFKSGKSSQQQQVANAVPPLLAKAIALEIRTSLENSNHCY